MLESSNGDKIKIYNFMVYYISLCDVKLVSDGKIILFVISEMFVFNLIIDLVLFVGVKVKKGELFMLNVVNDYGINIFCDYYL